MNITLLLCNMQNNSNNTDTYHLERIFSGKVAKSKIIGKVLAEKAIASEHKTVVFDGNGYLYHGRVKSLADGAREGGLVF